MKKNFLTICFITTILAAAVSQAEVVPIQNAGMPQAKEYKPSKPLYINDVEGMPDPNDQQAVHDFFKKRFEDAVRTEMTDDVDWTKSGSTSVVPYVDDNTVKEKNKNIFQQMYEEALDAMHASERQKNGQNSPVDNSDDGISAEQQAAKTATRFFILQNDKTVAQPQEEQIPTVSLSLPSGRRILAPALEHIPYFLSYIDIQSNGYIKVEDTISIVANGKKFTHGLERIFPKYSPSRNRIDMLLESVTVNDVKVPYIAEEFGDNIVIKPKYNQKLEPGVYTYKFNYLINYELQTKQKIAILDWNLTGTTLNTFITSANAIVSIPDGYSFRDIETVIGSHGKFTGQRTRRFDLAKNVVAFSNVTPVFRNEKMELIAVAGRTMFINDFDNKYDVILNNYGRQIYAGLGFLTIFVSFLLSLLSLKKERKNNKYSPSYNGATMRRIMVGKYDRMAFISQLLELYRKKALDFHLDGNRLFLIRGSSAKLNNKEKKALKSMFGRKSNETEVNNVNGNKLRHAKEIFAGICEKQINKFRFMHNIGYVLFSIAMLIITEIFIAYASVNTAQILTILAAATLSWSFYIWILQHKFKHKIIALPIKLFSLIAVIIIFVVCNLYIELLTELLIIAMVVTIFGFSCIFSEHNNFINDAKNVIDNFKTYLINNAYSIGLSRDFLNQQSNIFALDLGEYYQQNVSNKQYYKLDIAEALKQKLVGII